VLITASIVNNHSERRARLLLYVKVGMSIRRRYGQFLQANPAVFRGRPACLFTILMVGGLLLGDARRSVAAQEIPIPAQETSILAEGTVIAAQDTAGSAQGDQVPAVIAPDSGRACEGCPPRRVGTSLLQTTGINVIYEIANLVRGQVTAHITPKTWWENMQQGMVWDLDDFAVNQIGHPYQGNNYFNAGRANGLSFYESAAVTAFGSATWEFFGETNHASLNDFINTTLGGITLGEMFHRTGWLIRNTQATGKRRLWSEIGAMAVDPITGANRFASGDASRVTDKPSEFVPSSLSGVAAAGMLWRGTQASAFTAAPDPFLEVDGYYGDTNVGRSRTPYDAFFMRLRFGGGSGFSEARVRGRLYGQPLGKGGLEFLVLQTYNYQNNDAYATGSQAIDAGLGATRALSRRTNFWILGWGGLTVLGAVDSLPLGVTEKPEEGEPSAGQGVSEGPRFYDYGPGSDFGTLARLTRDGREFLLFNYIGRQIYSLDGVRANHFLQHTRVDVLLPLRGALGLGASAEYFHRRSYYQDAASTIRTYHYPQLRAYLTWGNR